MKWRITGADRATGEDKTITLDAADEKWARTLAKQHNLFVAEVEPITPIPDYAGPPLIPPTNAEPARHPMSGDDPLHFGLKDAASGLCSMGRFLGGLGWAAAILGFFAIIVGVLIAFSPIDAKSEVATIIAGGLSALAWGILLIFAGSMASTVGRIGGAVRDLAINSRK